MKEVRLRWFNHVKRRPQSTPITRVESITVDGFKRRGPSWPLGVHACKVSCFATLTTYILSSKLDGFDVTTKSKIFELPWDYFCIVDPGITLGRLVQNFELLPPPIQSKIDTSEKGGQFRLHILKHSTIIAKP
ncbi:hypothetical protein Tco_1120706 [Tanacetum coccineum]